MPSRPPSARAGVTVLGLGAFGIGLTEFIIAGLLTPLADDLGVTRALAGQLVTGYALAVVLGALALTPLLLRRPPRAALLVFMSLFVAGNLISALAPTYEVLMAGRVIAALCHGGFFGLGAVVAGDLVRPDRRASAIAHMFLGLTLANVLGVPLGTFVGQSFGWRSVFWLISVVGVAALAGLRLALPPLPTRDDGPMGQQVRSLLRPQVLASAGITALAFGGLFGAFTYIEPVLTEVSGFPRSAVPWLLVLFGAGLTVGNVVGGKVADRSLVAALVTLCTLLPLVLAVLAICASARPLTVANLFLLGAVGFATVPGLQLRMLQHAADAPVLASAANIAAFNLGNTMGAAVGGFALPRAGLVAPIWVGVGLCLLGLLLLLAASRTTAPSRKALVP